jgi:hypothetical protein
VTEPATIVELISARLKKSVLRAWRKFSSVGFDGQYWSGVLNRSPSGVNAERTAQ